MSKPTTTISTEYLGIRHGVPIFCNRERIVWRHVVVPPGTETDLASVPWCLRWLCPRLGLWDIPAAIHDFLCQKTDCPRFMADAMFRVAMADYGVPLWRRVSMYYAVRIYAVLKGIK